MLRYSLQQANRIVVLDRFMCQCIADKGIPGGRIEVIAPWSHDEVIRRDESGRQRFRARHGLADKFVVMYSGNHCPCHPLDTLLAAAARMFDQPQTVFCFVGGGKEFQKVQEFARQRQLPNIVCLPYQPLEELSGSLSAADLHAVVLGDPFVGIVHPCKVYNILRIGTPFVAIGPETSHLTDLLAEEDVGYLGTAIRHGDVDRLVRCLETAAASNQWSNQRHRVPLASRYSQAALLPRLIAAIEDKEWRAERERAPLISPPTRTTLSARHPRRR